MSERRSARATKGQHKTLELLDQPVEAPAKKGRGRKAATAVAKKENEPQEAEDGDGNEIILCICGATEQDDDSDEKWICCEDCGSWQHNICMGVTTDDKELDTLDYGCQECRPQDHKETLAAIARGEKPWEKRQQEYEQSLQETKKKKKGKKRASDIKGEAAKGAAGRKSTTPKPEVLKTEPKKITKAASKSASPAVPVSVKSEDMEPAGRFNAPKRKADEPHDEPVKTKARKVSLPQADSQNDVSSASLPAAITLPAERAGVATLLLRNLIRAMHTAKRNGTYKAVEAELDSRASQLSLEIEKATFDTHPSDKYIHQARALAANLKTNQDLCDRLLDKSLTPKAFAIMTVDQMASKELKQKDAKMKAQADKQSIMVSEEGPRIRRTHKGDEVIEDNDTSVPAEEMPVLRRRSMLDPNGDMTSRDRENSLDDGNELPQEVDDLPQHDDIRSHVPPLSELKTNSPADRKQSTQTNEFDINKVYSSVQTPTGFQHTRKPSVQQNPDRQGPGDDPEIDKMLEDGNESPPYSPAEYDTDPSIVWRGTMQMTSIASFPAVGRHIAGADLSKLARDPVPFSELIPQTLTVAGRIDTDRATEYLCSLRFSAPSDVVVIALSPSGEAASDELKKLYDYFISKNKYGVVGNKIYANVRDTYLIPVPAGSGPGPEFMSNLECNKLPANRPEPLILVALVTRHPASPNATPGTQVQPGDGGAPVTVPQRQMSMSAGPTIPISPVNSQGPFMAAPSQSPGPHQQQVYPNPHAQSYQSQPSTQGAPSKSQYPANNANQDHARLEERQKKGVEVAREILGDLIEAPTVGFLLPQAHTMQATEWNVVKKILMDDELARHDLPHLSKLLESSGNTES